MTGQDGIFMVDASFAPLTGKITAAINNILQFYDEGNIVRYRNGDAFIKLLYEQLKPKT